MNETDIMKNSPPEGEDYTIIFMGINKTGTSTLQSILVREYGLPRALQINPDRDPIHSMTIEEFKSLPKDQRADYRTISGHMYFHWDIHTAVPKPFYYITLFRNPIDRVISFYYYILEKEHSYSKAIKEKCRDLEQFVTDGYAWNNLAVKYLCSDSYKQYENIPPDALISAKENFDRCFPVFGITERFPESAVLFKRFFKWQRAPVFKRGNITRKRPGLTDIPDTLIQMISEYNKYDIELYEYAAAKFQTMVSALGSDFEDEVKGLKELNSKMSFLLEGAAYEAVYDFGRGEHLARREDDLAVKHYSRAVSLHPNYLDAYNDLGVAYFKKANFTAAGKFFEKALSLNHLDKNAVCNYADLLIVQKDYPRAKDILEGYLLIYPGDVEVNRIYEDLMIIMLS